MAKRPRSTKTVAVPANVQALGNALKFVSCAQRDIGQPYQSHVRLAYKWAVAYDGILTAACPIPEELDCSPHTIKLAQALAKCVGSDLSITLHEGRLAIKSGAFRVFVPCIMPDLMPNVAPDPIAGVINDKIKEGFEKIGRLASDTAEHVLTASIMLLPNSMLASDRTVMLEYWHGIDLPPHGFVIPKASTKAIVGAGKSLTRFGFSETSFTFYFEDGSWIKTQLYNDKWPASAFLILAQTDVQPRPIPPEMFAAVAAVAPHNDFDRCYFCEGVVKSHKEADVGAEYAVPGIEPDWCFAPSKLLMLQGLMAQADFGFDNGIAYFWGDSIRGAVCSIQSV